MDPVVLPHRAIWPCRRGFVDRGLAPQHHLGEMSHFCWFSDIGTEAWNETHARYTEGRLAARAYATAACIWVVAAIREHIQDAAYFAARADFDAALQLMTDDFVDSWGPHFSPHGRARRARRLAAQEAIAAAAAGAASADRHHGHRR
ncbi:hypothetical protein B0H14DRAFT_3464228 [Mycena olivaceomarginata]|nr:hypothetical protein B0H14DRAFT_3464228 [Mycena olivaceomarginata]